MSEASDEPWAEICASAEFRANQNGGLAGIAAIPSTAITSWCNKSVYIQVKEDGSGQPMFGEFSLRVDDDGGNVWLVWQPLKDQTQDASTYTMCSLLAYIHSFRLVRPSMGTPQVIINLRNGSTNPPLFFHSGGVMELKSKLSEHATLTRSDLDASTLLVNDTTDMLQRSLNELELVHQTATPPPGTRSRAATKPSSPLSEIGEGGQGDSTEWKWRALQGGVQVMQGLRTGWAKASAVAIEAASTAVELLDQADPISVPVPSSPRGKDVCVGMTQVTMPSPIKPDEDPPARVPRISLDGSLQFADDGCVVVEHEPVPWDHQPALELDEWKAMFDTQGRLKDFAKLKRRAYYGGLSAAVRKEGWKYLLGCYPSSSTKREREALFAHKVKEYEGYRRQWQSITVEQEARFSKFRDRRHRIEKDVVRTDRSHPVFAEDDCDGLKKLHNILLTYSFYNFDLSYCQGMSDLAAPLLVVMEDEVEAFWCFQKLMNIMEPNFHKDQNGMHTQLQLLHHLCQTLEPDLYRYLEEQECSNFYFCFRWLLIIFKREFVHEDVKRLWDAFWSNERGENLHLFVAVGILRRYKHEIMGKVGTTPHPVTILPSSFVSWQRATEAFPLDSGWGSTTS